METVISVANLMISNDFPNIPHFPSDVDRKYALRATRSARLARCRQHAQGICESA